MDVAILFLTFAVDPMNGLIGPSGVVAMSVKDDVIC